MNHPVSASSAAPPAPTQPFRLRNEAALAGAFASISLFLEVLRAHRGDYWTGWTASHGAGAAAGVLFYCLFYWVCIRIGRTLFRSTAHQDRVAAFAAMAGFIALWGVLYTHWPGQRWSVALLIAALGTGPAAVRIIIGRWAAISTLRLDLLTAGATLSGAAAGVAVSYAFLLQPELRGEIVAGAGLGWAVLTALVLLGATLLLGKHKQANIRFGIIALATVAAPAIVAPLWSYRYAFGANEAKANLVLVTVDCLRADELAYHGAPTETPAFDALAESGAVFMSHYSLAPWTLPAMNSMFASTFPKGLSPNGTHKDWLREMRNLIIDPETPLLAELLGREGYVTASFGGNQVLDHETHIQRGFGIRHIFAHSEPQRRGPLQQLPFLQDAIGHWLPSVAPRRPADTTAAVTRLGKAFVARYRGQPYFLWLHYMDPHSPYDPPRRYRSSDGPWELYAPLIPWWGTPQVGEQRLLPNLPPGEVEYIHSLYRGEIQYVDEALADIRDTLQDHGAGADTYVCVTSDHGEEFNEHGGWLHGRALYEETMHVPLIYSGPDIQSTSVTNRTSALDVMPTLAELVGVPVPEAWQGTSRTPALRGQPSRSSPPIFGQSTYTSAPDPLQMVIDQDYKLIRETRSGDLELYDLDADPEETENRAGELPAQAERLDAVLTEWTNSFDAYLSDGGSGGNGVSDLDETLESLGYL